MNINFLQCPPIHVVLYRHVGPYEQLSPKFDELCQWASTNSIPVKRTIGIYWDNPDYTPARKLRSAACVEVDESVNIQSFDRLPLETAYIAGGEYATTTFVGPYEHLAPIWSQFTDAIESQYRRMISQNPAFEFYVNDASVTPPNQLITELYMPLV
jgi:hypothetical protein